MAYIGHNASGNFTTKPSKDTFSGNGSTTAFTLSEGATTNTVDVFVENVRQEPTTAYSVNGTTLTFTAAPGSGTNNIYVVNRGPLQLSATHPAAQALAASTGTFTGALSGVSATFTGDLTVDTTTLVVDSTNNNVGIGRTPVAYGSFTAFNVAGSAGAIEKIVHTGNTVELQNYASSTVGAVGTATSHPLIITTADTERIRVDTSGNVGIGTTSPTSYNSNADNLVVAGSGNTGVSIVAGTTDDCNIFFGDGTSSNAPYRGIIRYSHDGDALRIYTAASESLRIDSSGRLLLGTTSHTGSGASEGQQVIQFAGASQNGLYMDDTRTASGASNAIIFGRGTTYVGKIETTTAPATNYVSASDERLKENIENADDAGSKIDAIQVRKYDWIESNTHQEYGLIAQELQSIAPLAVSGDSHSDEMMGIDYSKLVPMLIKEIQDLRKRVTILEGN